MEPEDFNDIPKETIMLIGDMNNFIEFITLGATHNSISRIIKWFPANQRYTDRLIDKYLSKNVGSLPEIIRTESKKYVIEINGDNTDVMWNGEDVEIRDNKESFKLRRGDIDRIIVSVSNYILYSILMGMTNDKVLKFCWNSETNDFVWFTYNKKEKIHDEKKFLSKKQKINKNKKKK